MEQPALIRPLLQQREVAISPCGRLLSIGRRRNKKAKWEARAAPPKKESFIRRIVVVRSLAFSIRRGGNQRHAPDAISIGTPGLPAGAATCRPPAAGLDNGDSENSDWRQAQAAAQPQRQAIMNEQAATTAVS
jgi:hypothetical protein